MRCHVFSSCSSRFLVHWRRLSTSTSLLLSAVWGGWIVPVGDGGREGGREGGRREEVKQNTLCYHGFLFNTLLIQFQIWPLSPKVASLYICLSSSILCILARGSAIVGSARFPRGCLPLPYFSTVCLNKQGWSQCPAMSCTQASNQTWMQVCVCLHHQMTYSCQSLL